MHLYLLGLYITASRTEQHQKNIDVTINSNFLIIKLLRYLGGGIFDIKANFGKGGGGVSHISNTVKRAKNRDKKLYLF